MAYRKPQKKSKSKKSKKEVLNSFYSNITNKIIAQITAGAGSWIKCWKNAGVTGLPHNGTTNTPYKGVNIFALWTAGFSDCRWATYNQIKKAGGQVSKGQKGTQVIFWKPIKIKEEKDGGTVEEKRIFVFKIYTVFNFEQTTGLEPAPKGEKGDINGLQAVATAYLKKEGVECKFGGNRAFYSPKADYIKVPNKKNFKTPLHFDSTLFHEIAHSTGHKSRLNREGIAEYNYFGSHRYSYEELVAEMTAVFSMAKLGLMNETSDTFGNSAAYLKSWASKLGDHPEWINKAAKEAFKATEYIFKSQK